MEVLVSIIRNRQNNIIALFKRLTSRNEFRGNLIILLGLISFTVIGFDFDTEFSVQQDEIDYVVAVLNKTETAKKIDIPTVLIYTPPSHQFVISFEESIPQSDLVEHPTERAPPV